MCRDGVFVHLGECLLFVWVSQPESVVTCPATSVQHVTKVCMFAIISSAHGTIKSANTHLKTSTFASIVPLLLQYMPGEASDVCEAHLCSYLPAVRGFNARSIAQLERPEAEYRRPNLGFHALPGTLGCHPCPERPSVLHLVLTSTRPKVGDCLGGLQFTHLAGYQARGKDVGTARQQHVTASHRTYNVTTPRRPRSKQSSC